VTWGDVDVPHRVRPSSPADSLRDRDAVRREPYLPPVDVCGQEMNVLKRSLCEADDTLGRFRGCVTFDLPSGLTVG
jgi:hypothetical protein